MNVAEAAESLLAADVPVLMLDACIHLDIVRATRRELRDCVGSAVQLRGLLKRTPAACRLLAPSNVPDEFRRHVEAERDGLTKHLAGLDGQRAAFESDCQAVGIVVPQAPRCSGVDLPARLAELAGALIDPALCLTAEPEFKIRAHDRMIGMRRPARNQRGLSDCMIVEECLELARRLRAKGFRKRIVFCSSNTEDFCEGRVLHPSLADEFNPLQLIFAANLAWAVHLLGK